MLEPRAGDPVVLKGANLTPLRGAVPNRIVGYRWTAGGWDQIPVQVDERHTISARKLYPDAANGYVGTKTFSLEVYADGKTRSGLDGDATFDGDDELVFMGGDAGAVAPGSAPAPRGVDAASAAKVAVADKLAGGSGVVYLFRAAGAADPSAGTDYVRYDFRLTGLTPGQTLLNNYRYFASFNPEDSRVTTASYELHSYDRWMEDELKVKAGNASRVDFLDRETAQATRTSCGRSQYTFSGRWKEDITGGNDTNTDTEGAYVVVKDGPVRALRSYVGANSGPYTQREHIYYSTHEVNTISLRVHVITDLYSWTDFAPSAIGMAYRDAKNPGGKAVDGSPDTLTPTTQADFAAGGRTWQQLSGAPGSVSTVFGAVTDIPNPKFANYHLDSMAPGSSQVQCGGDGKSIGASGFGILGTTASAITPNTDPRTSPFNRLEVHRTRFFGPPSDGAAQAAAYTARVKSPLSAAASASPMRPAAVAPVAPVKPKPKAKARLKITLIRKAKARKGKAYRVRIRIANRGGTTAKRVQVCARGAALRGKRICRTVRAIGAGKAVKVTVRKRVRVKAKGRKLRLRITARSGKVSAAKKLVVAYRR